MSFPKRGEVYWTRFESTIGSEQAGTRPAVIVQNDAGNEFGPTTIVAAFTSKQPRRRYPFVVAVPRGSMPRESFVNCCQVRTVDKSRLVGEPVATLDAETMQAVDEALRVSLGLY